MERAIWELDWRLIVSIDTLWFVRCATVRGAMRPVVKLFLTACYYHYYSLQCYDHVSWMAIFTGKTPDL